MASQKPLTRNQNLVLASLQQAGAPLSAYSILDKLRDEGLKAPLQIYRALETLVERALVHRLESLNAFVACAGEDCHQAGMTGFAICDICGKADEFSDFILRQRLEGWAQTRGFQASHSIIEIKGTCATCARGG